MEPRLTSRMAGPPPVDAIESVSLVVSRPGRAAYGAPLSTSSLIASGKSRAEPRRCVSRIVIRFCVMAKAISVRLDDDAEHALRTLESSGLSRSEAIRSSLVAFAEQLRRSRHLAAEAAALEADEEDRAEMLAVASVMESLRATR